MNAQSQGPPARARSLLAAVVIAALVGCNPQELDSTYGKRRGTPGSESVNGTAVLAGLFEGAGHRVSSWPRLSPKIREANVIVWFPNRFLSPTAEQRTFLMDWLEEDSGRTLVYVGRDFDAQIGYWKKIRPTAPAEQATEIQRREAVAVADHDHLRDKLPLREQNDWYEMRNDRPQRMVKTLGGPWSEGILADQVEIELGARLEPPSSADAPPVTAPATGSATSPATPPPSDVPPDPDDSPLPNLKSSDVERLLVSEEDTLVMRLTPTVYSDSQIFVVTNGSFLLNLPLVNHEHRKLAGKLVAACGPPGRVVFLESGPDGPAVLDEEPGANAPTGFEVFTVWPIGVILLHLTALGILTCVTLFPIAGRPKELPPPRTADFGQHVTALGEMLELGGDEEYAWARWQQYQDQIKHESHKQRSSRR